jgi:tetratricopeptide (TPR) repeat protein
MEYPCPCGRICLEHLQGVKMKTVLFHLLIISAGICPAISQNQTTGTSSAARDSLLRAGITAYIDGRHEGALNILRPLSDSLAQAAYYLGSAYVALGDNMAAVPVLKRAVALSPSQMSYHVQLARVLAQTGKSDDAEIEYRRVLATDSVNLAALTNLGTLLTDRRAYRDGAELLAKAITLNPRNAFLYYQMGTVLAHLGLPDSARELLSTSITLNGGYVPALTLLASLYFDRNEYDDALRMYSAAAERNKFAADLWYKVGICQEKLDNFTASRKSFLKAVEVDSLFEYAFAHLGQACYRLGMLDSAVAAYQRAIDIDKENPLYHVNLGFTWARMDSVEQAAESYRNAIGAMRPEQIGQIYERMGGLRFSKQQYRQSRDAYIKAMQFDPRSGTVPYSLALSYDHLKQYTPAVTWYKKFLKTAFGDSAMAKQVKEAESRIKLLGKQLRVKS